jgi:hypothetical protein
LISGTTVFWEGLSSFKFMTVIHTAYATIMMLGPKGVISLKSDQCDALACENAALTHTGRFSEKEAQELAAKRVKTHGASTQVRTVRPTHQLVVPPNRLQRRRAHLWAPRQTNPPQINRRMTRRRGPQTKKFQWTPTTPTRSFISAQSSIPNRNSCSSLFSRKIWISSHGRYQIRRAHSWAPHQTSPPQISQRMTRRRGAQTRKFQCTPNNFDKKLHLSTELDTK